MIGKFEFFGGGVIGEVNDKGIIIYKAGETNSFLKKNGNLKAKHADLPRYKPIPEYEDKMIEEYQKLLSEGVLELTKVALSM